MRWERHQVKIMLALVLCAMLLLVSTDLLSLPLGFAYAASLLLVVAASLPIAARIVRDRAAGKEDNPS